MIKNLVTNIIADFINKNSGEKHPLNVEFLKPIIGAYPPHEMNSLMSLIELKTNKQLSLRIMAEDFSKGVFTFIPNTWRMELKESLDEIKIRFNENDKYFHLYFISKNKRQIK